MLYEKRWRRGGGVFARKVIKILQLTHSKDGRLWPIVICPWPFNHYQYRHVFKTFLVDYEQIIVFVNPRIYRVKLYLVSHDWAPIS